MELKCIIFAFSFIPIVYCVSLSDEISKKKYDNHINRLDLYICNTPQPRVIDLMEIIVDEKNKISESDLIVEKLQPTETILHRCDNSGCCDQNEKCSPNHIKYVPLMFFVSGENDYVELWAKNHTECVCKDIYDAPK